MSETEIKFGGRALVLKFRPSHMREFENLTGETLAQALPKKGYITLATLLALGLKHQDERISVSQVFSHMDDYVESGESADLGDLWDEVGHTLLNSGLVGGKQKKPGKAQGPATS